jgi:hypothetical protein
VISNYIAEPAIVTKQHGTGTKTNTPMEQNWRSRNKPTIATAIWCSTKEPKTYTRKKTGSSINGVGNTGYSHI